MNLAVGNEGVSEFYVFKEPAFNTFDPSHLEFALTKTELVKQIRIEKHPLQRILENHLSSDQLDELAFFTIDVEGIELEVLGTNNWKVYRPLLVLVEALNDKKLVAISDFLAQVGCFFAKSEFKKQFVD